MCKTAAIYFALLFFLESLFCCASKQKYSSQEFFQTSQLLDLCAFGRGEFSSDILSALSSPRSKLPASHVRFEPPFLDFKEHPIGEPHLKQVTLINSHSSEPLQLLSISSTAPHFHCSFFKTERVQPGGNATFDVVFLATRVGATENTLYIRTSAGHHRYQVFGIGLPSPYRVRAMLGARIPLNASFAPSLQLYNPHSEPLQVTEMFSSSADLHLELPVDSSAPSSLLSASTSASSESSSASSSASAKAAAATSAEAGEQLWRIPPYETRTLMRLRLIGRSPANHTAFVRLRTSLGGPGLVLPVQVQVSGQPGLYACSDRLHFGQILSGDAERQLQLRVTSLHSEPILVSALELDSPNAAVRLQFRSVQVLPGATRETPVAIVTFDPSRIQDRRLNWAGNIILRGANGSALLSVPYEANLLHGTLAHAENATRFNTGTGGVHSMTAPDAVEGRPVPLKNSFDQPVAVTGVEMPPAAADLLSVVNFSTPALIQPGETRALFRLRLNVSAAAGRQAELHLIVRSNATSVSLPVFLYTGLLTLLPSRPQSEPGTLDLGTVANDASTSLEFSLRNDNPLPVSLESVSAHSSLAQLRRIDNPGGHQRWRLDPGESAAYRLTVRPPTDFYGVIVDELSIRTSERGPWAQTVQYILRTADGALTPIPAKPLLESSYPGRPACRRLSVHSSFPEPVRLQRLEFLPPDPRFHFDFQPSQDALGQAGAWYSALDPSESVGGEAPAAGVEMVHPRLLRPFQTATIGKLCFDHRRVCGNDCYVGFSTSSSTGIEWLAGLGLGRRTLRSDQYHLARLRSRWSALTQSGQRSANATVQLVTEHGHLFLFEARASLAWPSLFPGPGDGFGGGGGSRLARLDLPVTQIGKTSTADLVLENPTDQPVLAHLVPLSAYPGQASALTHLGLEATLQDAGPAFVVDSASAAVIRLTPTARGIAERRRLPAGYPDVHPDTLAVLLPPRQRAHLPVTFRPVESAEFRVLFLLRNNLTGLEPLLAVGRGARPKLRSSVDSLEFSLTNRASSLDLPCQRAPPTILRQITIVNPGPLTIDSGPPIVGRAASGCSEAGFVVAPCAPIRLGPNETLHLAVTYTPDLCQLRTTRELRIGGDALRLTLRGGLTPIQAAACSARLPRPAWESPLQTGLVGAMLAAALWAIMSACVRAERLAVASSSIAAAASATSSAASASSTAQGSSTSAQAPKPTDLSTIPRLSVAACQNGVGVSPGIGGSCGDADNRGLLRRLVDWLPLFWWWPGRRSHRFVAGAVDSKSSTTLSSSSSTSVRSQTAIVGRQAVTCSPTSRSDAAAAAASTASAGQQVTARRSRKSAAAPTSDTAPSSASTTIRTPQFEPISFPQSDRKGKPLAKAKQAKTQKSPDTSALAAAASNPDRSRRGSKSSLLLLDQLQRQSQQQQQQLEDSTSSSGSASDWETAPTGPGNQWERVGGQRTAKTAIAVAAASAVGTTFAGSQQQQQQPQEIAERRQSPNVPIVSVRAVPLQPVHGKQPKTSVVKPMMTHARLRRDDTDESAQRAGLPQQQQQLKPIAASATGALGQPRQQQQRQTLQQQQQQHFQHNHSHLHRQQQQQQLQQPQQQPPTGLVAPWCQDRPLSELAQVTLQKSQRMFHYEELRRQQQLAQQFLPLQPQTQQQQQQQQAQQQQQQQDPWYSAEAAAWPEPTLSNRSLWGGFLGGSGGRLQNPSVGNDEDEIGGGVGSSSDPVARMLLGETLLWDAPAPASSGWACFPDRQA